MKYKTLFRLLIKYLGVSLFASGFSFFSAHLIAYLMTRDQNLTYTRTGYYELIYPVTHMALGLYLFFSSEWVVDKAIPSNRPYCSECGYELTKNASGRCPECGVATRNLADAFPKIQPPNA